MRQGGHAPHWRRLPFEIPITPLRPTTLGFDEEEMCFAISLLSDVVFAYACITNTRLHYLSILAIRMVQNELLVVAKFMPFGV
jgi:hypothetical protein